MILGASYSQLPLYEAARQLGVSTVAASTPGVYMQILPVPRQF